MDQVTRKRKTIIKTSRMKKNIQRIRLTQKSKKKMKMNKHLAQHKGNINPSDNK